MTLTLPFDNSYASLPGRLFVAQPPTPVAAPSLVALNRELAEELGLDAAALASPEGVATLAGNAVAEGSRPIAQAYAGHQFGGWVPQLGDGRAVLLGEVVAPDGRRVDIQLKGAGRTPFSRSGDGRAWLGPVLREYIVSEAMHALGVPTTRALAAVLTGENVLREAVLPGAVLTRVASSHVRVGTFQYLYARQDLDGLRALTDHVIARHYPEAAEPFDLLQEVVDAQARLVATWMSLGFVHGVMNTDNMSVAGETIDYGPCAFLDGYHPETVFSSIDRFGRYAYARQPDVAVWNLAQFATSLLPLMGEREPAVERATEIVNGFAETFRRHWLSLFRSKIGLTSAEEEDAGLVERLLDLMAAGRADFTLVFRGLRHRNGRGMDHRSPGLRRLEAEWAARDDAIATEPAARRRRPSMARTNPAVDPAQPPHRGRRDPAPRSTAIPPWPHLGQAMHEAFCGTRLLRSIPTSPRLRHRAEEVTATFCGT